MRLLVDISAMMHRAAHKLTTTDKSGNPTNVIFGTLRSLEALANALAPEEIVVCWDGGNQKRLALYPEYKQNRRKDEEWYRDYHRQKVLLSQLLDWLPVVQVHVPEVEADDIIACLATFLRQEEVGIVTGDEDLFQLVGPKCMIIHPRSHTKVDLSLKPKQYIAYKVLVGDTSDNIKGVLGCGEKTAKKLLKEYKTLKRIRQWSKKGNRIGRMTYEEALPIIKRNLKLVTLDGRLVTPEEKKSILDQYRLRRLSAHVGEDDLRWHLKRHGMVATLARLSGFLVPFYDLQKEGWENAQDRTYGLCAPFEEARRAQVHADLARERMDKEVEKADQYTRKLRVPAHWAPSSTTDGVCYSLQAELDRLASPGDGARASGTVRSDHGKAWTRRIRKLAPRLFDSPQVLSRLKVKRGDALRILQGLLLGREGREEFDRWFLKRRTTRELLRLKYVVGCLIAYPDYTPNKYTRKWLERLAYDYGMEPPDWMRSIHDEG